MRVMGEYLITPPTDGDTENRSLRSLRLSPPMRAEDAEHVLTALANGMRITHIGSTPGLPAYWVINLWRSEYPEFDELCVAASQAGADKLAWETIEIADADGRAPADKALSIAVRERMAKVLNRKKYDPAVKVEVTQGVQAADKLTNAELEAMVRRRDRGTATDAVIEGDE